MPRSVPTLANITLLAWCLGNPVMFRTGWEGCHNGQFPFNKRVDMWSVTSRLILPKSVFYRECWARQLTLQHADLVERSNFRFGKSLGALLFQITVTAFPRVQKPREVILVWLGFTVSHRGLIYSPFSVTHNLITVLCLGKMASNKMQSNLNFYFSVCKFPLVLGLCRWRIKTSLWGKINYFERIAFLKFSQDQSHCFGRLLPTTRSNRISQKCNCQNGFCGGVWFNRLRAIQINHVLIVSSEKAWWGSICQSMPKTISTFGFISIKELSTWNDSHLSYNMYNVCQQ